MIKITAPTIEQALLEAHERLKCPVVDLEYEIVEHPSKGFLGFGKKNATIVVSVKESANRGDSRESAYFNVESRGDSKYDSRADSARDSANLGAQSRNDSREFRDSRDSRNFGGDSRFDSKSAQSRDSRQYADSTQPRASFSRDSAFSLKALMTKFYARLRRKSKRYLRFCPYSSIESSFRVLSAIRF